MSDPIAEKQREWFRDRAIEAYRKAKDNRAYCVGLAEANELGAIAVAYRDVVNENGSRFEMTELTKCFEQLAQDIPGLRQNRPEPEEAVPTLPLDVNGNPAQNPWQKGFKNVSEQMAVEKRDPKLAAYLREISKGISYSMLFAQQDERARREKLRQLK